MLRAAITTAAVLILAATGAHAIAEDLVIHQREKTFDPETIKIQVGQSIKFVNDDTITHNVLGRGANSFDLGAQKPGDFGLITFKQAGTVEVHCAIHPKMKMTVEVQP